MWSLLSKTLIILLLAFCPRAFSGTLLSFDKFISLAFDGQPMGKRETLWINQETRDRMSREINYQLSQVRIRYWANGKRTAWVLEEVGKEQPITMGVVVDNKRLQGLHILEYRESRGDEVKYTFFTRQFDGVRLNKTDRRVRLDRRIDGITGATLSVRAVKKVAKLALLLHELTPFSHAKKE